MDLVLVGAALCEHSTDRAHLRRQRDGDRPRLSQPAEGAVELRSDGGREQARSEESRHIVRRNSSSDSVDTLS